MKCFGGRGGKRVAAWLPKPPAYSALALQAPTVARTPAGEGRLPYSACTKASTPEDGGSAEGQGCLGAAGLVRYPVRSGRGAMRNRYTSGAAGCPSSLYPTPQGPLHRHPCSGRACQRKWGRWVSGLGAQGSSPKGRGRNCRLNWPCQGGPLEPPKAGPLNSYAPDSHPCS